ncbi:hypothetical protein BpHYR1_036758 [Brachionus plicatilis]|uniref:Uncharacterized protein n=1 Tax=Brachionus plicatilis TaxID=10195 RepID=A0A3M7QK98_BRAPC|nr:hypothetical protein BpHYR1_036758 [Brachionus plicatilis]
MVKTGKIVVIIVGFGKKLHIIAFAFNLNICDFREVDLKIEDNREKGMSKDSKASLNEKIKNSIFKKEKTLYLDYDTHFYFFSKEAEAYLINSNRKLNNLLKFISLP